MKLLVNVISSLEKKSKQKAKPKKVKKQEHKMGANMEEMSPNRRALAKKLIKYYYELEK